MSNEPKKETKKKKVEEKERADFSKSIVDLDAANFKNKDVQTWTKKTAAKQRGERFSITGLRGLGQGTRIPRLNKYKK